MLVSKSNRYVKTAFNDEAEIEKVVRDYAEYLFGSSILFIQKSKIKTTEGTGTIPDGFVIDIESGEWYILEAELAHHGTWQHIVPQVSKQMTAIESPATRIAILAIAVDLVRTSKDAANVFAELGISQIDIHGVLEKILSNRPTIAIPIDAIPADLQSWARTLKFVVKIWLIEKFQNQDGSMTIYSIPEENSPTVITRTLGDNPAATIITRSSEPYQDIFEAGLIKDGQKIFLEYGPRGREKKTFTGLIRKGGVELDGVVMALSTAAVECMRRTGSQRQTANGWAMWKTENGALLDSIYAKLYSNRENNEETKTAPVTE
ncbi:hypothetical protein WDW37_18960 [Bdellovibrionota bacterium FG-1]